MDDKKRDRNHIFNFAILHANVKPHLSFQGDKKKIFIKDKGYGSIYDRNLDFKIAAESNFRSDPVIS